MKEFTIYLDEFITIELLPALYDAGKSINLINDYPDREEKIPALYEESPYKETALIVQLVIEKKLTKVSDIVDFIHQHYEDDFADLNSGDNDNDDIGFSLSELMPQPTRGLRQWNAY